jgi:uncharacterized protein (TIGR00369 family)
MEQQTRTYGWGDPREMHKAGRGLSGLDFMRLLATEKLGRTPMLATLDYRFGVVEEGRIELICEPGEFMYNPMGVIHGGVAATLLDTAASCAVHSTLPAGMGSTTLDLSVHLLRPLTDGLGPLLATGTVVNKGRRTALGMSEIRDGNDRLLAHATASCMLFAPTGEHS